MAVSKQPSITPETSSGEGLDEEPTLREAKWKRFHPLRVVRKIFRRRIKRDPASDASKKSWSTSELQNVQDDNVEKCDVTSPLKIGLSVSHDSIFSPENNTSIRGNEALEIHHPSPLSVRHTSLKNMFKDELFVRIRSRRDSEDDGIEMQSSPYSSPTTVDVLNQGFQEKLPKSQTTYSAGSLLSTGSSENDEGSTGHSSGHSSRMSLIDRRSIDSEGDLEGANSIPLNHTAAHHKISVRPKRTYGLPQRRMKQVAASKAASLPSTPELTEDLNKCLQKLEVLEIIKSSSVCVCDYTNLTNPEFPLTLNSSTEKNTVLTSSSVSSSEISQIVTEFREDAEKTFHTPLDINLETNRSILNLNVKQEYSGYTTGSYMLESEIQKDENNSTGQYQKSVYNMFSDNTLNLGYKIEDNEIMQNNLNPYTLTDKPECDSQEEISTCTEDAPVKVAAVVKSYKSDSFEKTSKIKKSFENTKQHSEMSLHDNTETKQNAILKENELKYFSELKATSVHSTIIDDFAEKTSEALSQDLKMTVLESSNETFKRNIIGEKLNIDSEFVLKPLKKDRKFSGDSGSAIKDAVPEMEKDNSAVCSVYQEEESIMCNKYLPTGVDEMQLFASHQTFYSNNFDSLLVTEPHSCSAVDEKYENYNPADEGAIPNKEEITNQQCVNCNSDTLSEKNISSFSTVHNDKQVSEDKINESINVKSESTKLPLASSEIESKVFQAYETTPDSDITEVKTDKPLKQVEKSHLPDISSDVSIKNTSCQKRLSVEIVPFSQRMRERKYQPISLNKSEESSEKKKKSTVLVDRKLSDRKVVKNKELDKSSNRHSFSGSISSENKKDDLLIPVKEENRERVQYPVQIRIHKSNPMSEVIDKNSVKHKDSPESKQLKKERCTDVQHHTTPGQVIHLEKRHLKEKMCGDSIPKWEIKIQPATSQTKLAEEKNLSIKNSIYRSESFKSPQTNAAENNDVHLETLLNSNQAYSLKSTKDSSILSDDPEPELLRVFARRSIKQKHCDKDKGEEKESFFNPEQPDLIFESSTSETSNKKRDVNISLSSTIIKISENAKPHISKPDLRKKSKSFCEKEKVPRSVSPLKEMNLIGRDGSRPSSDSNPPSDTHSKQRLTKMEDCLPTLPLVECEKKNTSRNSQSDNVEDYTTAYVSKDEQLRKSNSTSTSPSTSMNGNFNLGMVKEAPDMVAGKDALTPSWLQLAQQRRELREQRERLLLGGSSNSFMDGSNKPSRSSKVWDMVNNFQKLQMT